MATGNRRLYEQNFVEIFMVHGNLLINMAVLDKMKII